MAISKKTGGGSRSKNLTPQQIALFAAATIALILVGMCLVLSLTYNIPVHLAGIFGVVGFLSCYFVFLRYLRHYIYRKIKLVYKTIHQHKLNAEEKNKSIDVQEDILNQVEQDVSKWILEQNYQIAELKRFNEYRQRFLGDISHELKTPIFNVQGYLETLLDGGIDDENIRYRYVEKAARNVERLNTIVEDLESISRLENGWEMLDMQVFGLRTLVLEVFDELQLKAEQRHIKLGLKPGADDNMTVLADRENIRQVLINLVNNSIKYGKENGETKVAIYDMDTNVLVEVADNGLGISEDHLPRIFERFYRVDKSRSRSQGGSGLGLSIVKHIIEAHDQTVNVRSSPGLGTTFGFTLKKAQR